MPNYEYQMVSDVDLAKLQSDLNELGKQDQASDSWKPVLGWLREVDALKGAHHDCEPGTAAAPLHRRG